jgi:hypothetical protein
MSRTPAAELARFKVAYPAWTIRAIEPGKGTGCTAQRQEARGGLRSIYAPTLAGLEERLAATARPDGGPHHDAGTRRNR